MTTDDALAAKLARLTQFADEVNASAASASPLTAAEAEIAEEVAWQRQHYGGEGKDNDPAAVGRLVGMEDALAIVRKHIATTEEG